MALSQRLFALLQYPLPQHPLSRLVGRLARCRQPLLKDLLIRAAVACYGVDLSEAEPADIRAYRCFNEFFTRALQPGARPIASEPGAVVSPADGRISQFGPITEGRLLQAKGKTYGVTELLGGDPERARPFQAGSFVTIYLSPRDYHRLHMPLSGTLRAMVHVPGRLFSVNAATTAQVPGLFARNERVVTLFDSEAGPMAVVLVGAIFVASIETVWHGVVTPPAGKAVQMWEYPHQSVTLERGAELGRFNMGSTVVVLFGQNAVRWRDLAPGLQVRMGQTLAWIATRPAGAPR
ncbi:archaetidylserine decarboxylase [Candidatus Methylocalor cossyra]|uniref:Phosphatidylserine decarboxylase proenzyme n=1 Tax=Candidatus Methylocalor cossyra TaxID=3108543 RepID=A0ABM9NG32_9GAMM